jgi:hypothetical protein
MDDHHDPGSSTLLFEFVHFLFSKSIAFPLCSVFCEYLYGSASQILAAAYGTVDTSCNGNVGPKQERGARFLGRKVAVRRRFQSICFVKLPHYSEPPARQLGYGDSQYSTISRSME